MEETLQLLMNSRIKNEEEWQMSRRYWRGLFHLISDRNYYKRMNGDEGGGGGGSSSGRTGTRYGSMSYSINGVEGKIIYRFKDGQDKEQVEKKLKEGLDWQCADEQTSIELAKYFNDGNTINVDVTMSGFTIAELYKKYCVYDKNYANGSSTNDWNGLKNLVDGVIISDCNIPEFIEGWIYIASEFLNEGPNDYAGVINVNTFNLFGWEFGHYTQPCTFNNPFSHEMGHRLDSFFSTGNIDRELSAYGRTKRQWDINERGWYSIP